MIRRPASLGAALCAAGLLLASCATIAPYQEHAYQNATTLKAESDALLGISATITYPAAAARVERVDTAIDAAFNYAAGLGRNRISAAQWRLLRDDIFRRFTATWRAEGKVGRAAAAENQGRLDRAFDTIICLEANKRAATKCPLPITDGAR